MSKRVPSGPIPVSEPAIVAAWEPLCSDGSPLTSSPLRVHRWLHKLIEGGPKSVTLQGSWQPLWASEPKRYFSVGPPVAALQNQPRVALSADTLGRPGLLFSCNSAERRTRAPCAGGLWFPAKETLSSRPVGSWDRGELCPVSGTNLPEAGPGQHHKPGLRSCRGSNGLQCPCWTGPMDRCCWEAGPSRCWARHCQDGRWEGGCGWCSHHPGAVQLNRAWPPTCRPWARSQLRTQGSQFWARPTMAAPSLGDSAQ